MLCYLLSSYCHPVPFLLDCILGQDQDLGVIRGKGRNCVLCIPLPRLGELFWVVLFIFFMLSAIVFGSFNEKMCLTVWAMLSWQGEQKQPKMLGKTLKDAYLKCFREYLSCLSPTMMRLCVHHLITWDGEEPELELALFHPRRLRA